jgi:hypothetical protein
MGNRAQTQEAAQGPGRLHSEHHRHGSLTTGYPSRSLVLTWQPAGRFYDTGGTGCQIRVGPGRCWGCPCSEASPRGGPGSETASTATKTGADETTVRTALRCCAVGDRTWCDGGGCGPLSTPDRPRREGTVPAPPFYVASAPAACILRSTLDDPVAQYLRRPPGPFSNRSRKKFLEFPR